jgi:hypothetical protein
MDDRLHSKSHIQEESNDKITPMTPLHVQTLWGTEGFFVQLLRNKMEKLKPY